MRSRCRPRSPNQPRPRNPERRVVSDKVELRGAYEWTCPECGIDHFVRGISLEPSEEEATELREHHGIDEDDVGNWMLQPESVTCPNCHQEFETVHYNDDEECDP